MIAIVDYGAGNIFSVKNALDYLNLECTLTSNKDEIISSDAVILPGVGAFPEAVRMLEKSGLVDTIKEQAEIKPFLGICLGMQLIGLINGSVQKMDSSSLIIPHMGWNKLETLNDCKLLDGLSDNAYVYFVHSYKAVCDDKNISAYCEYDGKVPALVYDGNFAYGAQFHPEKSGETGLKILKNFGGLIK